MNELRILGLLISDRIKEAGRTQEILSRHAGIIRSRLGFHELSEDKCSRVGFILLHLSGTLAQYEHLQTELATIGGIEIKEMVFNY